MKQEPLNKRRRNRIVLWVGIHVHEMRSTKSKHWDIWMKMRARGHREVHQAELLGETSLNLCSERKSLELRRTLRQVPEVPEIARTAISHETVEHSTGGQWKPEWFCACTYEWQFSLWIENAKNCANLLIFAFVSAIPLNQIFQNTNLKSLMSPYIY